MTLFDREQDASHAPSRRATASLALAVFVLALALSAWWHRASAIHDTDSYFHLAMATLYATEGVRASPPLRGSLLGGGPDGEPFGDKEWLFHVALVPFVSLVDDPLVAGRTALALATACLAVVLALLAVRAVGPWGALLPFWLMVASTPWAWRLVRLRPEVLALALMLIALWAFADGRARLLGVVVVVFTLLYTAFHALVGLIGLCVLAEAWIDRRWHWRAALYTLLGAGLGLLIHPHFPTNLELWGVQNVRFFFVKGALDVGNEILPTTTDVALMAHLGWLAGLVVFGRASRPGPPPDDVDRRLAHGLAIASSCFGGLYLLMSRFVLYAVPLVTLWWLFELRRRGRVIGHRVRLPGRGTVPLLAATVVCLGLSLPDAWRQLGLYHHRTSLGPERARIVDRENLAAAMPEGARVAADWGPTATYLLWAPHGRYLNALDPIFLAAPSPDVHRHLRRLLDARALDVPATLVGPLDSDHLAFPTVRHDALIEQLRGDPRIDVLHRGSHTLVTVRAVDGFTLDWRIVPPRSALPVAEGTSTADWPSYPRSPHPAVRAIEGFVDLDRVAPEAPCVAVTRSVDELPGTAIELTAIGPTTVWRADRRGSRRVAALGRGSGAILGGGLQLTVQ
ncbi:MAG: hypothetical protein AAGE94_07510, partial [Acidobacteriota bacterium]